MNEIVETHKFEADTIWGRGKVYKSILQTVGRSEGPHKLQSIGAGFIPHVLDRSVIDDVVTVANDRAFEYARLLAKSEGIPGGISTGANVFAAIEIATRAENSGKTVVTFAPSSAERYFSSDLFL